MTKMLFISDLHAGLKVGGWPTKFRPDEDAGYWRLNKTQKFVNKQLKTALDWFDGKDTVLVTMGDLVHGPEREYPDAMVTADVKTQAQAAIELLLPFAARASSIYCIDDASRHHVDPGRFSNDYIASELGAFGKQSYPVLDVHVQNIHIRLKHHGPNIGYRHHTEGGGPQRFMHDMHMEALERGEECADIFVFGHWHRAWAEPKRVSSPKGERILWSYYCPALSSADTRTKRNVARLQLSNIGTIGLEIENGKAELVKMYQSFDGRKVVRHG